MIFIVYYFDEGNGISFTTEEIIFGHNFVIIRHLSHFGNGQLRIVLIHKYKILFKNWLNVVDLK